MIHGGHDNYHHVTHCVQEHSHLQTLEKGERMKREGITETKFFLGNEVGHRDELWNNSKRCVYAYVVFSNVAELYTK